MRMTLQRAWLLLVALPTLLLATEIVWAQTSAWRLRPPAATAKGFIGGESHDSYVIHARKGQIMTVQISWRREHDDEMGDNHVEFWAGDRDNFDGDGAVKFGEESDKGTRWSGKIPKTADYYIYVMGHPTAHYTLRVTVR